ncbi:hypothetical protein SSPO_095240 [Streptomyces antimycoticus]|uniref:Carboxymuconolactone decarboxylase-like domain-containing protein n=1 Tax=Streptomyces antimycoticus TaxID=68175 RepID=A0A499VF38_9ACTN|nr:hypothetical protein [Streptomyces antimycoticus]BBJ46806.1 hypothetical protein SSPO_095240 [Streptomyces antimycoticus]
MSLPGALAGGVLPAPVRERLALATAEYNRCTYGLSAHTFLGKNVAKLDRGKACGPPPAGQGGAARSSADGHGSLAQGPAQPPLLRPPLTAQWWA